MTVAAREVTCPSCGFRYDPATVSTCASCPLNAGCGESCCPECGFSSLDLGRSWVARLATRLSRGRGQPDVSVDGASTLLDLPCGARAVIATLDGIPPDSRERLQAYGLAPGRDVEITHAAAGVTVVRVGHVELAFEADLASGILVAPAEAP